MISTLGSFPRSSCFTLTASGGLPAFNPPFLPPLGQPDHEDPVAYFVDL